MRPVERYYVGRNLGRRNYLANRTTYLQIARVMLPTQRHQKNLKQNPSEGYRSNQTPKTPEQTPSAFKLMLIMLRRYPIFGNVQW